MAVARIARATCVATAAWVAAVAAAQQRSDGLTLTFLANEGVMLSSGGKKVLIDALFVKYKTGFATPADSTQSALAAARARSTTSISFSRRTTTAITFTRGRSPHISPRTRVHRSRHQRKLIDSLRGRIPAGVRFDCANPFDVRLRRGREAPRLYQRHPRL